MARTRKKKLTYEQLVETFVKASGLRKAELERLRVRDFYEGHHDFSYEEHWILVNAIPSKQVLPFNVSTCPPM